MALAGRELAGGSRVAASLAVLLGWFGWTVLWSAESDQCSHGVHVVLRRVGWSVMALSALAALVCCRSG